MKNNDDFLWNQFCRLGEMIGDGLHHEDPWISKEYKKLAKILIPNAYKDERKAKNQIINTRVKIKLQEDKCSKCGSEMKQIRSGSYVVKCINCDTRFKYKIKK